MKVRCKDINDSANKLTLGKTYEVNRITDHNYWLKNDFGNLDCFYQTRFEIVKEEERMPMDTKYEQIAIKIGQLVDKKNAQYGDAINATGQFLELLYPNGIPLSQYSNIGVLVRIWDKMKRISNGDQGDESAWNDIAGYGILMSLPEEKVEDDF